LFEAACSKMIKCMYEWITTENIKQNNSLEPHIKFETIVLKAQYLIPGFIVVWIANEMKISS